MTMHTLRHSYHKIHTMTLSQIYRQVKGTMDAESLGTSTNTPYSWHSSSSVTLCHCNKLDRNVSHTNLLVSYIYIDRVDRLKYLATIEFVGCTHSSEICQKRCDVRKLFFEACSFPGGEIPWVKAHAKMQLSTGGYLHSTCLTGIILSTIWIFLEWICFEPC